MVLIPPADVKKIIDVLVQKVVSNGPQFADMINQHMKDNIKYDFLRNDTNPYRPYYLEELKNAKGETQKEEKSSIRDLIFGENKSEQSEEDKQEIIAPEPDCFQLETPANLTKQDQEVIKLSAQFVAFNGQQFLQELTEKKTRRGQFDFLNPTHSLFGYFSGLVEQYSKIQDGVDLISRSDIIALGSQRYQFEKYQQEQLKLTQKLKNAGLHTETPEPDDGIDWHDFIIVQTIDLFDEQKPQQVQVVVNNQKVQDINEQIKSQKEYENNENKKLEKKNEILNDQALDPNMVVKHNYSRKPLDKHERKLEQGKTQKCPKCNLSFAVTELQGHIKICLMDTKQWLSQKQDREVRMAMPALAQDEDITKNLKRFASQRPDLYDVEPPEQQTKTTQQQVIWDGQSTSLTRTHANVAMIQQQQKQNQLEAEKAKRQKRD